MLRATSHATLYTAHQYGGDPFFIGFGSPFLGYLNFDTYPGNAQGARLTSGWLEVLVQLCDTIGKP